MGNGLGNAPRPLARYWRRALAVAALSFTLGAPELSAAGVVPATSAAGRREGTSPVVRKDARRSRARLVTALNPTPSWCRYYSEGYLDEYGLPRVYAWWTCGGYTPEGATRTR